MKKRLRVSFKTIQKKTKNTSFATRNVYKEEMAIIKDLPEELFQYLKQTAEMIIDKTKKIIKLVRNAQVEIPMKLLGYSNNLLITFTDGQLTAVSV
jgi:ribosome-associated toxin RatA of RatAB toxin-antitoxin module